MISLRSDAHKAAPILVFGLILRDFEGLVAPSGIEPELFALRGRRVNQLHHGAAVGWFFSNIPVASAAAVGLALDQNR
jgi:hypothetical protein